MACGLNKAAKVLTGCGCCFFIIGVIVFASAWFAVDSGTDIEFAGGSRSFRYNVESATSFSLYIKQSYDCVDDYLADPDPQISITYVATGETVSAAHRCGTISMEEDYFENTHDPPVRNVGFFSAADDNSRACDDTDHCTPEQIAGGTDENGMTLTCYPVCYKQFGDYQITASTEVWVVDALEEFAEAVGGLFAAMGLIILMVVFFLIGTILMFVACCCCCQGPDKQAAGPPVQGMVVGQPVASA